MSHQSRLHIVINFLKNLIKKKTNSLCLEANFIGQVQKQGFSIYSKSCICFQTAVHILSLVFSHNGGLTIVLGRFPLESLPCPTPWSPPSVLCPALLLAWPSPGLGAWKTDVGLKHHCSPWGKPQAELKAITHPKEIHGQGSNTITCYERSHRQSCWHMWRPRAIGITTLCLNIILSWADTASAEPQVPGITVKSTRAALNSSWSAPYKDNTSQLCTPALHLSYFCKEKCDSWMCWFSSFFLCSLFLPQQSTLQLS